MDLTSLLTLLLIGVAAGVLSGFIGIGGGLLIVPALMYFMGLSQMAAQGTSLALMLPPIGALAVMNYWKAGEVDIRAAAVMVVAFVAGGYFGSRLALAMDPLKAPGLRHRDAAGRPAHDHPDFPRPVDPVIC